MLKGLALTPPVLGRISIGRVVERNGKRLPERDDEFTITSQVQGREGWVPHPLDQTLRKAPGEKLRSIPVRLIFDDPDLNFRASYTLFDRTSGRPLCVGNGETCRRVTADGIQALPCPAPEGCQLAAGGACKPYGRLSVRIGDEDELGCFMFRTAGFNSIRTLSTRLVYLAGAAGGLLSTLPLELRLRGKSTSQSHRTPIYYVDLTTRAGMSLGEAVASARSLYEDRKLDGLDQAALDQAARHGLALGAFEESEEEGRAVVEEFLPDERAGEPSEARPPVPMKAPLADKLQAKAALLRPVAKPIPASA